MLQLSFSLKILIFSEVCSQKSSIVDRGLQGFLKTLQTFHFLKVFHIIRLLKSVQCYYYFYEVLYYFYYFWGSEFSSYKIELRNRVTQIDVILRVTNSKSKNKKLHFELLTRRFNFYFSTFELLTRSWKIKSFISSY